MNFLITGHTGFIGRSLTPVLIELFNESKFKLISRSFNSDLNYNNTIQHQIDLSKDFELSLLDDIDILINLAGEVKDNNKMQRLHVNFVEDSLNYIKKKNLKLFWLQLSSVGSYGAPLKPSEKRFIDEKCKLKPIGQYEITKSIADKKIIEFAIMNNNFSYCVARPSQVIGKEMINRSLLNLIKMVKKKLYFTIGSRKNIRSYVHIEDLVSAIIKIIENYEVKSKNKIYNISQNILLEKIISVIRIKYDLKIYYPFIVNEKLIRLFVYLISKFIQIPLTDKIISGLVARTNYSSKAIKKDLNFSFKFKDASVILKVDE